MIENSRIERIIRVIFKYGCFKPDDGFTIKPASKFARVWMRHHSEQSMTVLLITSEARVHASTIDQMKNEKTNDAPSKI